MSLELQISRRTDGTVYLSVEESFCRIQLERGFVGYSWEKVYQTQLEKVYQTQLEKVYQTVGESLP